MLKYYDMRVLYHPGKANLFVDSLSHITMVSVSQVKEAMKNLLKHVHRLARLRVRLDDSTNNVFTVHYNFELFFVVEARSKQNLEQPLMEL